LRLASRRAITQGCPRDRQIGFVCTSVLLPAHMNQLFIGTKRVVKPPSKGGYLLIADTVPEARGAQVFDPQKHDFDALHNLDYRGICDFVDSIDALFPGGETTLTKESGLGYIAQRLTTRLTSLADLIPPPPEKNAPSGHVWAHEKMQRILLSPVLSRVLCGTEPLSFKPGAVVLARIDRAELGDFDAQTIASFLMMHFPGHIVLPDAGSYLRDMHVSLLRGSRLIAGVDHLAELPEKFRQAALLMSERVPAGALFDDAVTLAKLAGHRPDPLREENLYNKFIDAAMA